MRRAVDACDPNVSVTIGGDTVDTATLGTYVVSYSSVDSAGNAAQVNRTVQVADTTAPVITLNGAASVTVECGDSYTELGATAADACDPNVSVAVGGDTVDTATPGTYVVTYDAVDASGNAATQVTRTVEVVDTTAPVITLDGPGSITLECSVDSYTEQGATAADDCDPNVSVAVGGDTVDATTPGTYVVTYDAVDASGNAAAQVTRTVQVADTIAPVLTLIGDDPAIVIRNETYTEAGADITEACDQNAAVVIGGNTVDTSTIGVYVVTYNATDSSGNAAVEITRTVKVIPRFATIVGLVGNEKVYVEKDSVIDGGIGARLNVDIKKDTSVSGSITSVEGDVKLDGGADVGGDIDAGDKVELDKNSSLGGSITAGDEVKLKQDSSVAGDVTSAGAVDVESGATVGGTITENAVVPPLPDLPLPMLNISAGGSDVEVDKNETLALAPGTYGKVDVREGGTLVLSSGAYVFEDIKVEHGSVLDLSLPLTIDVEDGLELGHDVQMDVNGGAASDLLIQVQGGKCVLKMGGSYVGTFLAPSADIKLEEGSTLAGALIGKEVEIKEECIVTGELALDLLIAAAADWTELGMFLRVVSDGAPNYYDWADVLEVEGAPDDDDDFDCISNELEYVLDTDPLRAEALPLPTISAEGQITWSLPLRGDLESVPVMTEAEVSTDMQTWIRCEDAGFSQTIEGGALRVTGPLSGGRFFMRLGVRTSYPEN